jgi:two-component system LytT family response regulator
MRALILDDEQYCAETLLVLLKKHCPQVSDVELFTDPELALEHVRAFPPDILFLDVEMPFMTGFDFLHALGGGTASVIFTTAHDTYAVQAFKVNAVDYLLKPIDQNELKQAVNKVTLKPQPMDQALLTGLIKSALGQQSPKRITIHTSDGIHLITLDDIIYCRSDGSYSYIYIRDQQPVMVSRNLSEMEALIQSPRFFRVHKTHLINQEHIVKVNKSDGGDVVMSNQEKIPIGRQRKNDFFEWLVR